MDELLIDDLVRERRDGPWWPFGDVHDGFTRHWWTRADHGSGRYSHHRVWLDGAEVARYELDHEPDVAHYDPVFAQMPLLEVEFVEVHDQHRGRGIGAELVRKIASRHPDRQLFALSEGADGFWAGLGWSRHDHPGDRPEWHRPLFLAPSIGQA